MFLQRIERAFIAFTVVASLPLGTTACVGQSSEEAPAPGYIQQGVKITAEKYKFTPTDLTFKAGVPITVVLSSIAGDHSFAVDALNLKSREAEKGKPVVFEFTVAEAGTYEFYCAHGSHKEKGMTGSLTITAPDDKP